MSQFVETYRANYAKTGRKGLICIPSGNHDMDRLARRLHGDELKIAFAFLLSMLQLFQFFFSICKEPPLKNLTSTSSFKTLAQGKKSILNIR